MNRDQLTQAAKLLIQLDAWEQTVKDCTDQVTALQDRVAQATANVASIRVQLAALGAQV